MTAARSTASEFRAECTTATVDSRRGFAAATVRRDFAWASITVVA